MIRLLQQDSLVLKSLPAISIWENANIWMWIALCEAVVIAILLLVITYRGSAFHKRKSEILAEQPDFGNIFNSAFNAEPLYKELSRVCHPDRFAPDKHKMEIADELFQRVSKNRNNIKALQDLKEEITQKLL